MAQEKLTRYYQQNVFLNPMFSEVRISVEHSLTYSNEHFYHEERLKTAKDIQCLDLFSTNEKVLLLTGIGGTGKTSLVKHFAKEWADHGSLKDKFKLLFLIDFRQLGSLETIPNFKSLLLRIYPFVFKQLSFEDLPLKKILIILDGLDECQYLQDLERVKLNKDSEVPNIVYCLYNLIAGENEFSVFLTSHPRIFTKYAWLIEKAHCFSLLGFSERGRKNYITLKFPDVIERIWSYLDGNTILNALSYIPEHTGSICKSVKNYAWLETATDVHIYTMAYIQQQYWMKKLECVEFSICTHIHSSQRGFPSYGEFAFKMLCDNLVILPYDGRCSNDEYSNVMIQKFESKFLQLNFNSLIEFAAGVHIFNKNLPRDHILSVPQLRGCLPYLCALEGWFYSTTKPPASTTAFVLSMPGRVQFPNSFAKFFQDWGAKLNLHAVCGDSTVHHMALDAFNKTEVQNELMFLKCFFERQWYNALDIHMINILRKKSLSYSVNDSATQTTNFYLFYFVDKVIESKISISRVTCDFSNILSENEEKTLIQSMFCASVIELYRLTVIHENVVCDGALMEQFGRSNRNQPNGFYIHGSFLEKCFELVMSLFVIISKKCTLCFYDVDWSIEQWNLFAFAFLNANDNQIKKLEFNRCALNDNNIRCLYDVIEKVNVLSIRCNTVNLITDLSWKYLENLQKKKRNFEFHKN